MIGKATTKPGIIKANAPELVAWMEALGRAWGCEVVYRKCRQPTVPSGGCGCKGRKPFQARLDDVSVAKSAAVQRYDGVREPAEDGGQTDRGEHG